MNKQLEFARECLKNGAPLPIEGLNPIIRESWLRCLSYGLDPDNDIKYYLSKEEVQQRINERNELCQITFPLLDKLYDFVKGTNYSISFADEDGFILYHKGDPEIYELEKKYRYTLGSAQTEQISGTNNLGTPMAIKQPLQIFGGEHFYEINKIWDGAGAPVFSPDHKKVIGAIGLCGKIEDVSGHTLGMIVATSEAITRQLGIQTAYSKLISAQKNLRTIIETIPTATLLANHALEVISYNTKALQLLGNKIQSLEKMNLSGFLNDNQISISELKSGLNKRFIRIKEKSEPFAITVNSTETGEYVMQFEKIDNLRKNTNQIIGNEASFTFNDIIGSSDTILETIQTAKIVAQNDATVLLQGESGTGKELFAQAIHNASMRAAGPFVAVNCGAIPKSLIESELFGYEGGSFTGAHKKGKIGKFELANGGTLFLDEIGDMTFEVQVVLLRAIQSKKITRIGSNKEIDVNIRIIAATNQDLLHMVANKQFREDLYYRINTFNIRIPPLRERNGDVKKLVEFFISKYKASCPNRIVERFSDKAIELLNLYEWPGNVRQLENVVERSIYMSESQEIHPSLLPAEITDMTEYSHENTRLKGNYAHTPSDEPRSIKDIERSQIQHMLIETKGNIKRTAELLEINRRTLYRKIQRYSLNIEDYRK